MRATLFSFPLAQIGQMLRRLSLSGAAGNALAIIIYLFISLLPVLFSLFLKRSRKSCSIDLILPVQSLFLFAALYYMINPGLFVTNVPGGARLLLGSVFYSLLFGYIILRILRKYRTAGLKELQNGLRLLLCILVILFACAILEEAITDFFKITDILRQENDVSGMNTGFFLEDSAIHTTYLFFILRFIVEVIPYILDICITLKAVCLLNTLMADCYCERAIRQSGKLASLCVISLAVTVISGMLFNLLQLLFHKNLYEINTVVSIPLFSIAFVLAVLLMAKYIRENQKLKQDNDLFI